jgi:hypothetical protein
LFTVSLCEAADGVDLHVLGFIEAWVMLTNAIVTMDIDLLEPVVQDFGWNSLVLPKGHKRMVQAMVDTHAAAAKFTDRGGRIMPEVDLVRGKGENSPLSVILLWHWFCTPAAIGIRLTPSC